MANYLDKAEFLNNIREYKARKKLNPEEPISEYCANAIMMIANKLANRPNFIGYSYRSDMVSDGIYTCLKYFDKFDPDHAKFNPFGYFSQICWFAFLQRIAKEAKQTAIKGKILSMVPFGTFDVQDQDLDEDFKNSFTEFLQEHNHVELAPKSKKVKAMSVIEECFDGSEINVDDGPNIEMILSLASEDDDEE